MQYDVAKHCSEPFLAGNFKAKCMSVIGVKNVSRERKVTTVEDIVVSQNTDEETARDLIEICDPINLRCPLENECDVADNESLKCITPKQCPLQSIKLGKNAQKRNAVVNYMFHLWETEKKDSQDGSSTDLEDGTVLLSVVLYHPVKQTKEQSYLLIAGQNLTVLKDSIQCISDHALYTESSHNPDGASTSQAKNKSGFFFIEGIFYNDMRDPYNRDYSTEIIEWAKTSFKFSPTNLGSFKSRRMEDTKFEELKIRLGYPYYYCHQGNCEHLMIFDDMRFLHADDPQSMSMYPYRTFKKLPKRKKCAICELFTARWITTNDALAFEDPSFFCPKCFDLLHYDENKKKVHPFEAYHFDGAFNA
ncbi:snRNA-activating protein complex subunit 3-like isoform X2 [Rhopilema esculentum]|uniref:snRNA-activating protein complex subunit 3-like isoform X2 n=1 Tax=Rhopilema esculentum TaxID=499914 RepID=UPI0031E1C7C6